MKDTGLLSIEIGRGCNLANVHTRCPSADVDRYGKLDTSNPITDDEILKMIFTLYNEMEFNGQIAFHYYNEPLMYANRMFGIIDKVRDKFPESKFFLNTNGTYIEKHLDKLHYFSTIILSNYDNKDWEWIREYLHPRCFLWVQSGSLDLRKDNFTKYTKSDPCGRPYKELVVDYYGNGHLCCMDWKGVVDLGNVVTDGFKSVVDKFVKIRETISCDPMSKDAPIICQKCANKTPNRTVV